MAIPNNTATIHHTGNVLEDIHAGMRPEDFPHLAALLTDLYSDPVAAVIREYSVNGHDSHLAAGVTRPVEITLPTAERLEFVVQDFGLGLSINDLRDVYSMYGRSLKRDSNNFAGQLGLGCKSGLAYAESFTITAVKDGVKVVAMSTKDEHGVGVIKVLDTLGTDAPNGVRIAIPVERYDVTRFQNAADKFFQFWTNGSVLVNGEAPAVPEWVNGALFLDDDTVLVRKDAGLSTSYVIMGNVPYPVEDATVGRVSHRFVARLNIGDVDFAPSREAVRHTTHTNQTLADLTEYIGRAFKRTLAAATEAASSRWEETLLRVMWMDRRTTLRSPNGDPVWVYQSNVNYGPACKSHGGYAVSGLAQSKIVAITGFTAKTVSQSARARLAEFCGAGRTFVILPASVSAGTLDGRPNTYAWADVLAATGAVEASNGVKVKRPKVETRYNTVGGPSMTADELADVSGTVLFLHPGEMATYGTFGTTVVALYSSAQLTRIQRYVPEIRHYNTELGRARKKALAAITDHDRAILRAKTLDTTFSELSATLIEDPELADAITMHKVAQTDTIKAARDLGVSIEFPALPDFPNRYPLASRGYYGHGARNDIRKHTVLYINAVYRDNLAKALDAKANVA